MALVETIIILIHLSHKTQVALLISMKISAEYSDFLDIYSLDSAAELLEHIRINDYPINLLEDNQLLYCPIYSLRPIELEALKSYIKANLASGFISSSKSPSYTLILFVWKKYGSLHLIIDY